MSHSCAFCHADVHDSKLYVSLDGRSQPNFRICSACYLVAIRHGYAVLYNTAA